MGASPDPAYILEGVRYHYPGSADGFALEIGSLRVETASVMDVRKNSMQDTKIWPPASSEASRLRGK